MCLNDKCSPNRPGNGTLDSQLVVAFGEVEKVWPCRRKYVTRGRFCDFVALL